MEVREGHARSPSPSGRSALLRSGGLGARSSLPRPGVKVSRAKGKIVPFPFIRQLTCVELYVFDVEHLSILQNRQRVIRRGLRSKGSLSCTEDTDEERGTHRPMSVPIYTQKKEMRRASPARA